MEIQKKKIQALISSQQPQPPAQAKHSLDLSKEQKTLPPIDLSASSSTIIPNQQAVEKLLKKVGGGSSWVASASEGIPKPGKPLVASSVQASSNLPTVPGQRVELKDLTWEDKEKVLRLMFTKINGMKRPM